MRHRSGQQTTRESIGLFRLMDQTLNGRCPMKSRFKDRRDAGRKLATMLTHYANDPRVIVLALPRGGVPVAVEVATVLGAELDILTVRKLGVPGQEELAMGAVASGGVRVLDESLIRELRIGRSEIDAITDQEQRELARRERLYRGDHPVPSLDGRIAIIVDDGLATGSTMRAAISAVRQRKALRIVAASPVGSRMICEELGRIADESVCYETPFGFMAVSEHYEDFGQTTDAEILDILEQLPPRISRSAPSA
jgi:predicted phosphoribosyltransferase